MYSQVNLVPPQVKPLSVLGCCVVGRLRLTRQLIGMVSHAHELPAYAASTCPDATPCIVSHVVLLDMPSSFWFWFLVFGFWFLIFGFHLVFIWELLNTVDVFVYS